VALLKLLRIKYSGFNVEKLIKQIDSLDDFESMFRLLQKLIDVIEQKLDRKTLDKILDDDTDIV